MQDHHKERFRKKVDPRDKEAVLEENLICGLTELLQAIHIREKYHVQHVDIAVVNLPVKKTSP